MYFLASFEIVVVSRPGKLFEMMEWICVRRFLSSVT